MTSLRTLTVTLANPAYIQKVAGNAFGYNYVGNRYIVFFTLRLKALGPRNPNTGAFKLSCDGNDLIWDSPYLFPGMINGGVVTEVGQTESGGIWLGPTVAWQTNAELVVYGVGLMYR